MSYRPNVSCSAGTNSVSGPTLAAPGAPAAGLAVLAASLGGVEAIGQVLAQLPVDFAAALAIVQHTSRSHRSLLPDIFSRDCRLVVKFAEESELLQRGRVYLAPPDRHLLVNPDGRLALSQAPPLHFVRPAADYLFKSAAASYGRRCVGVVLTGRGEDAAQGARAIREAGGIVIAQDMSTSRCFAMPRSAIHLQAVDHVLPLAEIGPALTRLARQVAQD